MDENKELLSQIVFETRKIVNDEKMINKCDTCQGLIGRYFNSVGIEYYPCSTNKVISNNITGHSFIVAKINDNYYLIDPAFIQFKYDDSEEIIINGMKCISKSPYYYLSNMDSEVCNELISNGYIQLNERNAYLYGNSFYFTKTAIPSNFKIIPIGGEILINSFLKGNDNLTNYNIGEIQMDITKFNTHKR